MIAKFLRGLRAWATGVRLSRAIEKNEKAAKELDAALREVLKQ